MCRVWWVVGLSELVMKDQSTSEQPRDMEDERKTMSHSITGRMIVDGPAGKFPPGSDDC